MAIRVDNELSIAAECVEQKTGFPARGNRVADQRHRHGNLEEVIILELVVAGSSIVGEAPQIPVGETARRTDPLIIKRDLTGIVADDQERRAGDIVVLTRMVSGRIDRTHLSIDPVCGREADDYRTACARS